MSRRGASLLGPDDGGGVADGDGTVLEVELEEGFAVGKPELDLKLDQVGDRTGEGGVGGDVRRFAGRLVVEEEQLQRDGGLRGDLAGGFGDAEVAHAIYIYRDGRAEGGGPISRFA